LPTIGKAPTAADTGLVATSQLLGAIGLPADATSLNKLLNFKVFYQDQTSATAEEADSLTPVPLKGIISDESAAATATIFASSLSKAPPFFNKALVKAQSVDVIEILRDKLVSEGFTVNARIDLVNQARKITNIITIVLGVFGITALIVSAIGMFNTMLVGFLERIYEVGILKSLGATDSDVRSLFLVESSIMGFLGGAGGVIIGMGIGDYLF